MTLLTKAVKMILFSWNKSDNNCTFCSITLYKQTKNEVMKKKAKCLLFLLTALLAVSCELAAPDIPESGTEPYQRPSTPMDVKVVSGQPDQITISWNHIDEATGFVIYGTRISDVSNGMQPMGRVTTNTDSFTLMKSGIDVDSDQSYLFSVRALKQFPGTTRVLESQDSAKVEGAFAPTEIAIAASLTDSAVELYWNSPNLYSGYNISHNPHPLYNARFTLHYGPSLESEENWKQYPEEGTPVDYSHPMLYRDLLINEEQFVEGQKYSFYTVMDIEQPDGTFYSVKSDVIELIVSGDMLPSPIKGDSILVSQGDEIEAILVSWTIPKWVYPVDRSNSYFKVERAESGSDSWTTLVDEISTQTHDGAIVSTSTEDGDVIAFSDSLAEPGTRYVYRITNSATDQKGVLYVQDDLPESSKEAYLYDPQVEMSGHWLPNEQKNEADVSLSWMIESDMFADDFVWRIARAVMYPEKQDLEVSVVRDSIPFSESSYDFQEVFSGDTYATYMYILSLVDRSGKEYKTFDMFPFDSQDQILGTSFPVPDDKPLVENPSASVDMANKISISWTEKTYEGSPSGPYRYLYSINGGEYKELATVDGTSSGVIAYTEPGNVEIVLQVVSADGMAYFTAPFTGRILVLPDESSIMAVKGEDGMAQLFWDGSVAEAGARYYYQVRKLSDPDDSWGTQYYEIPDFASGSCLLDQEAFSDSSTYIVRLVAEGSGDDSLDRMIYSAGTVVIAAVDGISASKGDYADRIVLEWNALSGVSGYNIYRGTEADAMEKIASVGEVSSYEDTGVSRNATYLYSVSAVVGDYEGVVQSVFGEDENHIGQMEAANRGYLFSYVDIAASATSYISEDGRLEKPYFTVEFNIDPSISKYRIGITDESMEIDVATLTKVGSEGMTYSNSKGSDEAGYVEFDFASGKAKANVQIRRLETDLSNSGVKLIGSHDQLSTAEIEIAGEKRRALDAYDYIYLFNTELNAIISYVDSSQFDGDWWGDSTFSSAQTYTGDGYYVETSSSAALSSTMRPGFIRFDGYYDSERSIMIATKNNQTVELLARNGYGEVDRLAGYLGVDPLDVIGTNKSGNLTSITLEGDYKLDGIPVIYDSATICLDEVKVAGGSGRYHVTIGDAGSVTIDESDQVIVKPFVK